MVEKSAASKYMVKFGRFDLHPVLTHCRNIIWAIVKKAAGIAVDG